MSVQCDRGWYKVKFLGLDTTVRQHYKVRTELSVAISRYTTERLLKMMLNPTTHTSVLSGLC